MKKKLTANNQERLFFFFFQLLAFISKTEDGTKQWVTYTKLSRLLGIRTQEMNPKTNKQNFSEIPVINKLQ